MPREQPKRREASPSVADLEAGLRIDPHALDEALLQQSDAYYRTSKELSLLKSKLDAAKQAVDEAEAIADASIRKRAFDQEEKVSETMVSSRRKLDPMVQDAQQEFFRLKEAVGVLSALAEAFGQRSRALHDLVTLYVAGYFGTTVVGAQNDYRESRAERIRQRVGD